MKNDISIKDLGTLAEDEKNLLLEYCRSAFADKALARQKTSRKSITLAKDNQYTYKLVAEIDDKRPVKTVEKAVGELGLSAEATKKILKGYQDRDIKKYQIADIKYLSELIQMLEPAQQKKAVDLIVQNRKDLYHVNKEDVVMLLISANQVSPYFAEVWYNGMIRLLEKINRKTAVEKEFLNEIDPIYQKDLKRKLKTASARLDELKQKI
ncbi:MAG TPA: hypothetical protein PLY40_01900 [Bacillota bacterium]|nr:hypothetical protein [Bacillota bacterium]